MTSFGFQNPAWLALLAILPILWVWRRRSGVQAVVVPDAQEWFAPRVTRVLATSASLAYLGVALLILGLARPQAHQALDEKSRPGFDIVIAIDLSTSMYAEDFKVGGLTTNRLQAIKPVLSGFISERPNDRIGIVVFAGRAYTFAPLTFDHAWLRRQSARLAIGLVEDGTAVGDAIGVALSRLRQGRTDDALAHRAGRFIVLLTDGSSNRGSLDPRLAAQLAADEGVVIHSIGAGAEGLVPTPIFDSAGNRIGTELKKSEVDSFALRDIAEITGGTFFRATDPAAVREAFSNIDSRERIDFEAPPLVVSFELFQIVGAAGLLLLCLATAMENDLFRFDAQRLRGKKA